MYLVGILALMDRKAIVAWIYCREKCLSFLGHSYPLFFFVVVGLILLPLVPEFTPGDVQESWGMVDE